jgi:TPR repeat protein
MLGRTAGIFLLSFLLALPTAAQDFKKGMAAHKRGDYAAAMREWRPLADRGDAQAQYKLAFMFERGRGAPQDQAEAVKWFRKAARQGQGTDKNDSRAVKWFRKAARQGHARAQYSLAVRTARGQGTDKNDSQAVKWFRRAAEQGHAKAQYSLGLRYSQGKGVPKNIVLAYMWWSLAALDGHEKAYAFRDSATKIMTPAEIAEGQRLAREWWARRKKKSPRGQSQTPAPNGAAG